jgi:hypothetical protein
MRLLKRHLIFPEPICTLGKLYEPEIYWAIFSAVSVNTIEANQIKMTPSTNESNNLDFHVAMQEERDKTMKNQIENLETAMEKMKIEMIELRDILYEMRDIRSSQLLKWAGAIIAALASALGVILLKILVPGFLKN